MLKLKTNKNQKINEIKFIEILFYTFPLSFIIGNLALSIHLLLFIIASLFVIQRKQLSFRFNNSCWLLIFFFLYFFISTTIQYQSPGFLNERIKDWPLENNPIFKSFVLVRFLILIFVVDTLFFNKILNLKKIFLFSLLCTSFVSFDVILQYLTGYDLFGIKGYGRWNPGPFGDEFISGSFLQKFSFFSIFYISEFNTNRNFRKPLLIFIIALHAIAILFSGNRMATLLFLLGCTLIILFVKKLRLVLSTGLLIFLLISFFTADKKSLYISFLGATYDSITALKNLENEEIKENKFSKGAIYIRDPGYMGIFRTSFTIWKQQPLLGYGLKSFRIKCWEILSRNTKGLNISCANHSHNYYLELLGEAGIIGAGLIIIFFLILLKDSFYYLKKYNQENDIEINLLIPIIIVLFLEMWPLKTTGSFFTTWNATFIWLTVALLLANKKDKKP